MENNKIKISELETASQITDDTIVPIVIQEGNRKITLSELKQYFRDSSLVIFDGFDDSKNIIPIVGFSSKEYDSIIEIVFANNTFLQKKTIQGHEPSYYTEFPTKNDYIINEQVRSDRVFFCVQDKCLYIFNNGLYNILNYIKINAMSEDEFNNITNPIEGGFYAIYE